MLIEVSTNADECPSRRLRGWLSSSSRRLIGLDFEDVSARAVLVIPVATSETKFGRVQVHVLPYVSACPAFSGDTFVSINAKSGSSVDCTSTKGGNLAI